MKQDISGKGDEGTWQKPLAILTTKDRCSEHLLYVTDILQSEEASRWKSINTHTHTHKHTHTHTHATHTHTHTHGCPTKLWSTTYKLPVKGLKFSVAQLLNMSSLKVLLKPIERRHQNSLFRSIYFKKTSSVAIFLSFLITLVSHLTCTLSKLA